ncbi:MAG: uracil phosphoribosyltransferase [Prochlorococcus sp.]
MPMSLRVVVPPHPLIAHWLTVLRNGGSPPALYATAMEELGHWLTYEAIRDWLPHRREMVSTDLGETEGTVVEAGVPLLALPVLPGGLDLWQGARRVLPSSQLCLGSVPRQIEKNAGIIIFIDQIASGQRLLNVLKRLQQEGVETMRLRVITALTANPGLKLIGEAMEDLTIHTACIDPELSETGAIQPGIGHPVKRLNTRFSLDPEQLNASEDLL